MRGVFNSEQHQAEVELLLKGRLKQFQVIPVPLDNSGIVKIGGGDQGVYQHDGNGLMVLNTWVTKDRTILSTKVGVVIYVQFNHDDNPFLPIGIPDSTQTTVQPFPAAYALTIGQMKFFVPAASVNAGQVIYLLLVKGVSIIGASSLSSAASIGTYASPVQNAGGGGGSGGSSPNQNPWGGGGQKLGG